MRTVVKFGYVALTLLALAALTSGCCKTTPSEVTDVNNALKDAMDACATVYAKEELERVEPLVAGMNDFAADKKCKKARKEAEALIPAVQNVHTVADQRREAALEALDQDMEKANAAMNEANAARKDAEARTGESRSAAAALAPVIADADAARGKLEKCDIPAAKSEMGELVAAIKAARAAQAGVDYSASKHESANRKLAEAKELAGDPCMYREADVAATEAARLAEAARLSAIESARTASDQQATVSKQIAALKQETAEALAMAAQCEVVREYTVVRGDYLWKISGMDRIYRAPKFWPLIFDANRGQIRDPDLIYPGQNLTIPRQMSDSEMMDKLRVMWGKASRGEDL